MMSDVAYSEDGCAQSLTSVKKVNLINKAYFENGRQSRIIGFEFNLDLPYDSPIYTVGETAAYSRIGELESKIESITLKVFLQPVLFGFHCQETFKQRYKPGNKWEHTGNYCQCRLLQTRRCNHERDKLGEYH